MMERRNELSSRTVAVLEMIAAGHNYEQILAAYPGFTYLDIFRSASEALDLRAPQQPLPSAPFADIRKSHPRAYEKWTRREEEELCGLIEGGLTVAQIANRLQRQRSAIRSRIQKLDIVGKLSAKEQSELHRISKLDAYPPDPSINPNNED